MLKGAGHKVTSAFGNHEAREACTQAQYELAIIGHSIPTKDKLDIISCFRGANPKALVIALTRAGEARLSEVDTYINPGDPEELIRAIERILERPADGSDGLRRVK